MDGGSKVDSGSTLAVDVAILWRVLSFRVVFLLQNSHDLKLFLHILQSSSVR